jgi:hypothetical protein
VQFNVQKVGSLESTLRRHSTLPLALRVAHNVRTAGTANHTSVQMRTMGLGALELKRHRCDRHCKRGKGSIISKAVHRAFRSLIDRLRQQCKWYLDVQRQKMDTLLTATLNVSSTRTAKRSRRSKVQETTLHSMYFPLARLFVGKRWYPDCVPL